MAVINMQTMRYINLLDKATRVKTSKCFFYNNTIFFAVDGRDVSRAIGPSAINVRMIQERIGKRIKIVKDADGVNDAQRFIEDIVSPVRIRSLDIKENCMTIVAGNSQNKAILIGRNKRRFIELKKIVQEFFGVDLKIA
ncbi:MAG: hypothetical protein AABX73_02285 [Nanoarchaeota archaeon]